MVSATSSSAEINTTPPGSGVVPSGQGVPVVIRAVQSNVRVDLPRPGSPSRITGFPAGSRPGHIQRTRSGWTSATRMSTALPGPLSLAERMASSATVAGSALAVMSALSCRPGARALMGGPL